MNAILDDESPTVCEGSLEDEGVLWGEGSPEGEDSL
jgi:hypothetical protein